MMIVIMVIAGIILTIVSAFVFRDIVSPPEYEEYKTDFYEGSKSWAHVELEERRNNV